MKPKIQRSATHAVFLNYAMDRGISLVCLKEGISFSNVAKLANKYLTFKELGNQIYPY